MHVVTAAAGRAAQPAPPASRAATSTSRRCVVSPYAAGLADAGRGRDGSRRHRHRHGRRHHLASRSSSTATSSTPTSMPIGGGHVTNDIARGLSTPLAHAERMKTLYGNCIAVAGRRARDDPRAAGRRGGRPRNRRTIPRSILIGIIQPRLEETFELVRSRLEAARLRQDRRPPRRADRRRQPACRACASSPALVLDKQVRIGRPIRVARPGRGDRRARPSPPRPAFWPTRWRPMSKRSRPRRRLATGASNGVFGRLGHWLRENF